MPYPTLRQQVLKSRVRKPAVLRLGALNLLGNIVQVPVDDARDVGHRIARVREISFDTILQRLSTGLDAARLQQVLFDGPGRRVPYGAVRAVRHAAKMPCQLIRLNLSELACGLRLVVHALLLILLERHGIYAHLIGQRISTDTTTVAAESR